MGDLSKNFSRSEFACNGKNCCKNSAPVHPDLITALQALRDLIGFPLRIGSGFRCNKHNQAIGGASKSFHTLGMAADISCPSGFSPESIAEKAGQIELFHKTSLRNISSVSINCHHSWWCTLRCYWSFFFILFSLTLGGLVSSSFTKGVFL